MVKTKPLASKKAAPKRKIEDSQTEVKASNDYRKKEDWWDDILSGETCRTADENKVMAIIAKCKMERRGINVQGFTERGNYFWYLTGMVTEKESKL